MEVDLKNPHPLARNAHPNLLIPQFDEIPKIFKSDNPDGYVKALRDIMEEWLFTGKLNRLPLIPVKGIMFSRAIAHLDAIMMSDNFNFAQKLAGCTYLASFWFTPIKSKK